MAERSPLHRSSVRLLFGYEGRDIRLIRRQFLDMIAPASDPIPKGDEQEERRAGFWVDLLDPEGRVLYRKVMGENPVAGSVSVYTGDAEHPFSMQKVAEPRGEFLVVVPDIPGAQSVALFGGPADEEGFAVADEIARFDLREADKGGGR